MITHIQLELRALANAGTDIRDRGAYIDALSVVVLTGSLHRISSSLRTGPVIQN